MEIFEFPVIRILYVIPTLDRSGAERQLALLATGLPKSDFEPHVVALTRSGPYQDMLEAEGVPVTVLGKRFRFDPFTWRRLRELIRQQRPDVLHSFLFAGNAYARLSVGARGPRVVCSERCVDSWKAGWQLALDRRLVKKTDRLLANSAAVRDFYENAGVPPGLITVIPNGVVDDGVASDADRAAMRREFGLPDDARVVVYAGRLAKQKRVHDLVWAFQLLRQTIENCCFIICGDGPDRPRIEQRIRHFDIAHLVRLAGHRADASQIVRAADVSWLGSDFEGMSNSLSEAMVAAVPCVATNIAPNAELIDHTSSGYLVTPGDAAAFQQFTLDLLSDPELAARMGQAARERMLRDFSVEQMVSRHAELYRSLVGGA